MTMTKDEMSRPVALDLCSGLGGWAKGFIAEGWQVVGFDIERFPTYPGQSILKDVREVCGYDLRCLNPVVVVASPPCQEYSLWGMRMFYPNPPVPDKSIWEACIRIAREAGVPLVIENVRGAQYHWGRSAWRCGPYHLWGDVPALFPAVPIKRKNVIDDVRKGVRRGLNVYAKHSSKSARKQCTAEAAEIPLELSRWIAKCYKPEHY